jgi:polyisoprenoid-binding protein YceI
MGKTRAFFLGTALLCVLAGICHAASVPVDVQHSSLTVRVFKKGLFSGLAHDHEIAAPLVSGAVDPAARSVEIHFDARGMKVLDPGTSVGDRAKVQETMLSDKVLDAPHFPEIAFVSRSVKPAGQNTYAAEGDLSLHGVIHPLTLRVSLSNGHYTGSVNIKQSDFGITPLSLAGGSVKVKDVVEISFDIVLQAK